MESLLIPIPEKGYHVPSKQGLCDEILTTVSAGNDTTGIANMVTLFHVVNNPVIHARLLAELKTVLPKLDSHVPYPTLEQLPYLVRRLKAIPARSMRSSLTRSAILYFSPPSSKRGSATPRLPHHVRLVLCPQAE